MVTLDARDVTDESEIEQPQEQAEQATEQADQAEPEPIPATDARTGHHVTLLPPGYTIVDEAQRAYDERRQELERDIATAAIEQVRLKAGLKTNRDELKELTDDLEKHLIRGPVRLPLFDQAPAARPEPEPEPAEETELTDDQKADAVAEAVADPELVPTDDDQAEPWRTVKLADLPGITEKIVEILDGHYLRTIGDWVDMPRLRPGVEYTMLKGITEKRFEKVSEAVIAATTGN